MAHKKHKASASAHAQDRAQRENHLSEAPPVSRSNKEVDQSRAAAESPLHGEDRPIGRPQGKQDRHVPIENQGNLGKPGHPVDDARFHTRVKQGQVVPEESSLSDEENQ